MLFHLDSWGGGRGTKKNNRPVAIGTSQGAGVPHIGVKIGAYLSGMHVIVMYFGVTHSYILYVCFAW